MFWRTIFEVTDFHLKNPVVFGEPNKRIYQFKTPLTHPCHNVEISLNKS